MGGPSGNGATEATAFSPARTPALALIDARGEVVRLTETFRAGFALAGSPRLSIWDFLADPDQRSRLGGVLEGRLPRADLALPSPAGSIAAEAEAVLDATITRHALVTVAPAEPDSEPRSGADTLLGDGSLDDSPAIVWIKDLTGRYLRINRRYASDLRIDGASIAGKTEVELGAAHVVAEPRLLGHTAAGSEPAQLEYTVEAADGRPALTVLRFPLHGLDGAAVAVCGVASTVADAAVARSEAERLLRIERWAGLSLEAIRCELFDEWQLAEVAAGPEVAVAEVTVAEVAVAEPVVAVSPPLPAPGVQPPGEPAGISPASVAELERLRAELAAAHAAAGEVESCLGAERVARSELETQLAEEAAGRTKVDHALAAAIRRADELVNGVATEASRMAELEAAVEAERARAEGLAAQVGVERARAEGAEREAAALRARVQGAEREVAAARARIAELKEAQATASTAARENAADGKARAELEQRVAQAQRRAEEAQGSLSAPAQAGGELVARAEAAERTLAAARADAGQARSELVARAERANAAAELSRGRAVDLETELERTREAQSESRADLDRAREAEAKSRAGLERARAETASLQAMLDERGKESELARQAAREATGRLDRELRPPSAPVPAAAAVGEAFVRVPSVRLVRTGPADAVATSSGPAWSHSAQRALTASLADAAEWRTGLKDALRILGAEGGWDVAVAWCPDDRARALRCLAMWMSAPDQLGLFETATWQRRQSLTATEVGRVAAGDDTTWLDDLAAVDDAQFAAAAGEGMRAALLVPIRHGEETSGVLELLTRSRGAPSLEIVSAMEAVGLQLAHFGYLLRQSAEPRWRIGRM